MKVQKNKYKRALQIMSLCEKHLNKSIDCYNMAVDYSGEVTVMGYFNNEVARRLIQKGVSLKTNTIKTLSPEVIAMVHAWKYDNNPEVIRSNFNIELYFKYLNTKK